MQPHRSPDKGLSVRRDLKHSFHPTCVGVQQQQHFERNDRLRVCVHIYVARGQPNYIVIYVLVYVYSAYAKWFPSSRRGLFSVERSGIIRHWVLGAKRVKMRARIFLLIIRGRKRGQLRDKIT